MTAVLLAQMLAATPQLWVATEGFDRETCGSEALAAALRAQRPNAVVRMWRADAEQPPAGAVLVRLVAGIATAQLEISGGAAAVARDLPVADGCERSVELAALIVDGALDEVRLEGEAPAVDSLAPPIPLRKLLQIGAALGGGVESGALGTAPSLDVQALVRYRFFELTLDMDFAFPESAALMSTLTGMGSLSVSSLTTEFGLGVAPKLGPGRLTGDLLAGLVFGLASASGTVFMGSLQTSVEPLVGLRVGYLFDLPFDLFAGVRAEGRLALGQTTFSVTFATPSVTTSTWAGQALGLVGYRFL